MTAIHPEIEAETAPLRIEMLDPASLLVDVNVRGETVVDKGFVASIRELGVLVPIVAVRDGEQVRVRYGHRRVLAAIEAGHSHVPVLVMGEDSPDAPAQVERILSQLAENTDRTGLTQADRVGAYEQLSAFGLSPAAISRRARVPRGQVNAALTVARSELAREAARRYDFLALDQAAVLAEFEGDPEAVEQLVVAARQGGFDHAAQRLRDARQEREERDRAREDLAASGVPVIDRPLYGSATIPIDRLTHDGEPLTEQSHAACPGHAAYLTVSYGHVPTEPPADGESDDADDGGDGQTWSRIFSACYVCTAPDSYGHVNRYASPHPPASTGRQPGGTSEQDKAARRLVIENNKAWRSAETVRREWLRGFLTRRTPPKGAATFVAACLAGADHEVSRALDRHHPRAHEILSGAGQQPLGPRQASGLLDGASEQRAQVITLALILAAYEDSLDVGAWRRPTTSTRRYLTALQSWGYELSDVEQLVITPTPEHDTDAVTDADRTDTDRTDTTDGTAEAPDAAPADDEAAAGGSDDGSAAGQETAGSAAAH
jgi:ParB family transcriptional regulator, chromosome partitioning protein